MAGGDDTLELLHELFDRGFTKSELDWVSPLPVPSHRRLKGQQLTEAETVCFLRALKIQAIAESVLGNRENALTWLRKRRQAFDGVSALKLMRTEAGGQLVEQNLVQLDEGYFA